MSLDTKLPLIIVLASMAVAIVLCAPLLLLAIIRGRRSPSPPPEYVLLAPTTGRDGS